MSGDDEIRDRILEVARDRFFMFGFSKVTMDEMAFQLGMSKKTLYKFFPSKGDLLREVTKEFQEGIRQGLHTILQDDSIDFVEKLKKLWTFLAQELSRIGQPFLQDIQRRAPDLWRELERGRQEILQSTMGRLINEGVRKKVFRRDVNQRLLLLMYSALIQGVINPDVLSQLPLSASQAHDSIRKVFFEGILTDEAREKYRVG